MITPPSKEDIVNYLSFGDICREQLNMQCQYGSRYADPVWSTNSAREAGNWYPDCGKDLRILGSSAQYHSMRIHKDDIDTFVKRVKFYKEKS
jgi:hypothetical protein